MQRNHIQLAAAFAAALFLGAIGAATIMAPAAATHTPANKMAAASSTISINQTGEIISLGAGTIKSSGGADYVISLSMECSILTQVGTVGNDLSRAEARIVAWIEIDGVPVGVNAADNGEVTFCDRIQEQETSLFDDDDATIRSYIATKSAHTFNWIALDLDSAVHTVEAKAVLTTNTEGDLALAEAVVGKRTLVVEPTRLANDVSL